MLDRPRYSKNEACGQEVSPEKDSTPRGPSQVAKGKRWNAENSQSDGIAANHSRMLNLKVRTAWVSKQPHLLLRVDEQQQRGGRLDEVRGDERNVAIF
jgi:hypothetical protein